MIFSRHDAIGGISSMPTAGRVLSRRRGSLIEPPPYGSIPPCTGLATQGLQYLHPTHRLASSAIPAIAPVPDAVRAPLPNANLLICLGKI